MRPDSFATAEIDPESRLFAGPDWPVRRPRTGEAAGLAAFMRRTFLQAYGDCGSREDVAALVAASFAPALQAQELADARLLTLTVGGPGVYAGYAQLDLRAAAPVEVEGAPALELRRFYVDRAFHGEGVAAELMQRVRDAARGQGARVLWLKVWQEAAPAIRFYRKQGFAIVGSERVSVGAGARTDWVMQGEVG